MMEAIGNIDTFKRLHPGESINHNLIFHQIETKAIAIIGDVSDTESRYSGIIAIKRRGICKFAELGPVLRTKIRLLHIAHCRNCISVSTWESSPAESIDFRIRSSTIIGAMISVEISIDSVDTGTCSIDCSIEWRRSISKFYYHKLVGVMSSVRINLIGTVRGSGNRIDGIVSIGVCLRNILNPMPGFLLHIGTHILRHTGRSLHQIPMAII